jgi:aminopeptidase N
MLLTLLALAQLQTPAQAALAARGDTLHQGHDALHYDITIAVEDTTKHVVGEVTTTWRLTSDAPVVMELDSAMRVVRVAADVKPGSKVGRTMWGRPNGLIVVPHEKHAGDTITTRVRYHGYPADGLIIRPNAYGDRAFFADNWPDRAHRWFPSQDIPSDKATVELHVQAPLAYQVIANGTLAKIDTLAYGNAVWDYVLDTPIPVYTMVVGIAKMARTAAGKGDCANRCVPVSVWTWPQDSAFAMEGPFRRAAAIVDWFGRVIGPFPYPSLTHVESSTIFGGMENATAIFYDEKAYGMRRLDEGTVAHETAHQWFGDAVTESDWHHLWLSEGFATYFSALWIRHADGDSAFRRVMSAGAAQVFHSPVTERPVIDTAAHELMKLLNTNNYPKGAWTLHELRGLIGDSAFFRGIRDYYRTYRNGTALSADFAAIMSRAAGADLGWFFRQALLQPGFPVLDVRTKRKGRDLEITVRQTQRPAWGTYRIPNLQLDVGGRRLTVDVNGPEATLRAKDAPKDAQVTVDPDGWWLLQSTVSAGR